MIMLKFRFFIASNHVYEISARWDLQKKKGSESLFDHKFLPGNPDKNPN